MRIVTKATTIQFINHKCHIKKRKSHKTTLSSYYACVSRDLLLMPSGADTHKHTQTYQRLWTKRFQETRHAWACDLCVPGLKTAMDLVISWAHEDFRSNHAFFCKNLWQSWLAKRWSFWWSFLSLHYSIGIWMIIFEMHVKIGSIRSFCRNGLVTQLTNWLFQLVRYRNIAAICFHTKIVPYNTTRVRFLYKINFRWLRWIHAIIHHFDKCVN